MTKNDYLKELNKYLKKLPHEDYQEAMEYFEEYFDEVGPEGEAQAIEEFGNPKEAAHDILNQLMDKHSEKGGIKSSTALIWIAILAILASPIALPVGIALIILFIALLGLLFTLLITTFVFIVTGLAMGFALSWETLTQLTFSLPTFLFGIGLALLGIGVSLLLGILLYQICRWIVKGFVAFVKWIGRKVN